jgi:3-isopropylmalate/(R)-2-methylmalate dehydratase small subunit
MARFSRIESHAAVIPAENIDTDQIIPARFLKVLDKDGLGEHLFSDWRYRPDGSNNPDFPLNRPEAQGAQVLLAGDNFGCGSSREHAPWALVGWGIRVVISSSFADIFQNNSLKNGLLPVVVSPERLRALIETVRNNPKARFAVDLERRELKLPDGSNVTFAIDTFAQHCLLNGIDQLGYILGHEDQIRAYEAAHPA